METGYMSNYRVIISHFIRHLVLAVQIADTAEKFIRNYLERYLRKEILEDYTYTGRGGDEKLKGKTVKGLVLGPLLTGAIKEHMGEPERKQKMLEDFAFQFTKPAEGEKYFGKAAEKIIAKLTSRANQSDIGPKDAEKIIERGGGVWDADDLENFEDLREDFIKIINRILSQFFKRRFVDLLEEKKRHPETDIPAAEAETKEFIKDFEDYIEGEKGSEYEKSQSKAVETLGFDIEDLREFIQKSDSLGTWSKPTEKDRKLFLTILDSNILKKKGEEGYKTQQDIAEEFDLKDRKNVDYQAGVLKKIVKNLMAQRGKKVKSSELVLPYSIIEKGAIINMNDEALPYSIVGKNIEAEAFKFTPKGELLKKKKELAEETKQKGLDRNPNKIERLRKEIGELTDKVYGKPEKPEDGKLQEELEKAKKQKHEEQTKKIVERRESPDFLRVKYKRTEKGKLEKLQEELQKEEAQTGGNRVPKKIERLEKEVKELEEKVEEDQVEGSVATRSHIILIENAIKDHEIMALIEFSANYDNSMLKEKAAGPVDFKYEKYKTQFKGTRKGHSKKGTWKKTVKYTYTNDLTPEGDFKESFQSNLELDDQAVSPKDKFKVALDSYVREHMVSEGLLPYGQSVTKMKEEVKFPTKYINTKLDKTYFGADHFFTAYQGLLTEDVPQKARKEIREKKEKQLGIGRSTERDIEKTIEILEGEQKTTEEKPEIEKQIIKLKKVLEQVRKFPGTEEAAKTVDESREWLLEKKKSKLEKITEEVRVEKAVPSDEKDEKKIRFLEKQKRKLERAVSSLESELKEKKSSLISIASLLRDIYAVTEEYMETSKALSRAQDALKNYKSMLRSLESTPDDIKKVIDLRKKHLEGLIGEKKEKALEELKNLETLHSNLEKGEKAQEPKIEKPKEPGEKEKEPEDIDITVKEKKRLEGLSKHKKMLEKIIAEKEKEISDYESHMEKSEGKPGVFPETTNEDVKDLYEVFTGAGVKRLPKMTLYGWVTPVQILQMAKQLQPVLRTKYEAKIDDMKSQKGKSEEDREKGIKEFKREHKAELEKARKAIKALPGDLKTRRDDFKKSHPSDFPRLKEPDWVDDSGRVETLLGKVDMELHEIKEKEKTEKKQTVNILEKTKFKSLGDFLQTGKKGLGIIARRFSDASLEAGEIPANLKSTFSQYIEKTQSDYSKAKGILNEVNKALKEDPDIAAEAEKAKAEFSRVEQALSGAKNILTHYETMAKHVPALGIAKALLGNLEYFSSLYNYYSSILWFGEKGALPTTEPEKEAAEFAKEEIAELSEIRTDIIERLEKLASTPLSNKKMIKGDIAKAKKDLKLFIDGYDDYPIPKESPRQPAKTQLERAKESFVPYEIIGKDMTKEEWEQKRKERHFPPDLKGEIDELLKKVEKKDPSIADSAKESLKKVEEEVKQRYKDSLDKEFLDRLFKDIKMEQGDMSDKDFTTFKEEFKNKGSAITGKVVDRLNRRVINDFINSLENFTKDEKPKKDTPYINRRPPEEYKDMWEFVNSRLPGLSKEAPSRDTKKYIEPGKPTPPEIRKYYEKAFKDIKLPVSEKTLSQMEKIFQKEYELPEGGGGGGAKSKNRPKVMGIDPPKGTYEIEKEWLAKKIEKHSNGHEVILDVLGEAIAKLKKERLKGNFYTGSVVDGMVSLLKEVLNKMKMLKVDTPVSQVRTPPGKPKITDKGRPTITEFSGRPDITISTDKDAVKVYEKMIDMIDTVNDFIEPDVVNVPPDDPKRMKPGKWYLPYGLMNYFNVPKYEEKKSSAQALAFQLAQKLVFSDIQSVNELTEEDLTNI